MKKEAYEPVEIEVIAFDAEDSVYTDDVITTSDPNPNNGKPNETPDLG